MTFRSFIVATLILLAVGCANDPQKVADQDSQPKMRVDRHIAADYNVQLGIGYLQAGEIARAKMKLNHALELDPKLSSAHYAMGFYLEKTGEPEKAQQSYLMAIRLNPKGGREHNNYGAYLCRQHRFDDAEREFLLAAADDQFPNTAEVFENAGMCAEEAKSEAKAKKYYEKALLVDGRRANSLLAMASYAYEENNIIKAKDLLNRYQQYGQMNERSTLLAFHIAKSMHNETEASKYEHLLKNKVTQTQNTNEMFVK